MKTTAKNFKNDKKEKKKLGLTTQIFIALLTGALLGVILCYLVPDSSFKNTILVGRHPLCTWAGLYPADENAGGASGILLLGLRKHGYRRHPETGKRRRAYHFILSGDHRPGGGCRTDRGKSFKSRHGPGYEHHPDQCFFCGKHGSRLPAGNPVEHHSGQSV